MLLRRMVLGAVFWHHLRPCLFLSRRSGLHMTSDSPHIAQSPAAPASGADRREPWGEDTVVALSTATGVGAIGIVRMSGPAAVGIAEGVFRPGGGAGLSPGETHRIYYGHVVDPRDGQDVDEVLLAVMRAPRSYTREDVVEVHCHGGLAAQRAVLRLLVERGGQNRLIEPKP